MRKLGQGLVVIGCVVVGHLRSSVRLDGFSPGESDVLVEGVSVWLSDVEEFGDPMVGFFVVPFWSMLVVLSGGCFLIFVSGWSFPGGPTLLLELVELCGLVVGDLFCWSSSCGGRFMIVSNKPGGLSLRAWLFI